MSRREETRTRETGIGRAEGRSQGRRPELGDDPQVASSRPRRRRRRPGRILGMWSRLFLLSGTLIVLLLIAVAIVAKAVRPYAEASDLKAQLTVLNRQVAQTEDQNNAYRRRLAYLQTPQGQMTEARSLGYLRPGEVPVVVDGTPGALSETPLTPTSPSAPTLMSRLRTFWHSMVGNR